MTEEEIIKGITNIIYTCNDVIEDKEWYDQEEIESAKEQLKFTEGLLDLYNKEKEKNKKAVEMLQEHIKHCEQEAKGSLNNEICHISLKFDKHLLQELLEERN